MARNLRSNGSLLVVVLFLTIGVQVQADPPSTLKLVSVLFRHGDRSPSYIYPTDIHQVPGAWPDGLGWLTNIGKQQHYELGQYLGDRYGGFLNTTRYNHEEIVIESSRVSRCVMSAESNLAGLFPPQGDQVWNPNLLWQPISVHSQPRDLDNKLAMSAPCPRYDQIMDEVLECPAMKQEEEDNKEFYDKVIKATGVKKESIRDIWKVVDPLICERAHNLTWNDWVNEPGVWDKLNDLRTLSFDLLFNQTEQARLKGGPLLKEVINNMKAATSKSAPLPKFYMYAAHDITVAAFLSAMKVFDCHQPTYGNMVMLELHQIDNDHVVKLFYKNTTDSEPVPLNPGGCESPCKLSTFIQVTKGSVPVDWTSECQVINLAPPINPSIANMAISLCIAIFWKPLGRLGWL